MSDSTIYLNLVAQALESDDTLRAMVDSMIIPGFRRSKADDYLSGTHQACIGIKTVNRISRGLNGCYTHGISINDHVIEIRVITLLSSERQDDSYANSIVSRIEQLLKGGIVQILDEIEYQVIVGPLNFSILEEEYSTDRIEVQTTARLKYFAR